MYIFKNALVNVFRSKGRNILIGIIILVITIGACIALTIRRSATTLVNSYIDNNKLEVSFTLNTRDLRNATDEERTSFKTLDIDQIKTYGDSKYVTDYYYTLETSLSSDSLEAVDYSNLNSNSDSSNDETNRFSRGGMIQSMGDFRLTSYSNFSYLEDFIGGTKKIKEGIMIEKDSSDMNIVISSELAEANSLKLNDTVTFYLPGDSTKTYTFKITGIYEDNSDVETSNFGFTGINAMNSRNQIYTNLTSINKVLTDLDSTTTSSNNTMISRNGITAKFYLKDKTDLDNFEKEVYAKGLNKYYSITTNEEQILSALKPIENLSSFSKSFLVVILIIGGLVLGIINMINVRERKYEIGVLRAIGMSKTKLSLQLISEIFIVSVIALIIGTSIGVISSQKVTNYMLQNEIKEMKEESQNLRNNFGSGNFERPSINGSNGGVMRELFNQSTNYLSDFKVTVDMTTISLLVVVGLALTMTTGFVSSVFINKYEPNKILQNRI